MKLEIATTNIIYKSQSPIGTNKTLRGFSTWIIMTKVSIPYRYKQNPKEPKGLGLSTKRFNPL